MSVVKPEPIPQQEEITYQTLEPIQNIKKLKSCYPTCWKRLGEQMA